MPPSRKSPTPPSTPNDTPSDTTPPEAKTAAPSGAKSGAKPASKSSSAAASKGGAKTPARPAPPKKSKAGSKTEAGTATPPPAPAAAKSPSKKSDTAKKKATPTTRSEAASKEAAPSPVASAVTDSAPRTAPPEPTRPEKPEKAAPAPAPSAPPTKAEKEAAAPVPTPAAPPKKGITVQLGSTRPKLALAPGAMISGHNLLRRSTPEAARQPDRKLTKKELTTVRAELEDRRDGLLAGMKRELAVQRERAGAATADEVDKATDAYDEELSFEIASANDEELKEIAVALEKIELGTYGECEHCGAAISPSRLRILPFATTCVTCRGQDELSRRRDDGAGSLFSLLGDDEPEANEPEQ